MRVRVLPKRDRGVVMRELQRGPIWDLDRRGVVDGMHELLRGKVLVRSSIFVLHGLPQGCVLAHRGGHRVFALRSGNIFAGRVEWLHWLQCGLISAWNRRIFVRELRRGELLCEWCERVRGLSRGHVPSEHGLR